MAKVKPIPDGFHTITPHIVCKNAAAAMDFYKKAFGAEEIFRMPGPGGQVMHGELQIGDSRLMLADEFPQADTKSPASLNGTTFSISLYVEDCDKAFKRAVDAGCKVTMPPMDMFWGDRFCKVGDPYGHSWSIMTHIKDLSPEEIAVAGEKAMKEMCKPQ